MVFGQVLLNFRFREDKPLYLFMGNGFQIGDRDFVAALVTGIFGAVGGHIQFGTAVAEGEAEKEGRHLLGGWIALTPLLSQDRRASIPERHFHDGSYLGVDPFAFRFERPVL